MLSGATSYLSTMTNNDCPEEYFKDLVRDLHLYEWRKLGQDFEIVLDDCPLNTKRNAYPYGPYFCRG